MAAALALSIALPVKAAGNDGGPSDAAGGLRIISRKATADPDVMLVNFEDELPPTSGPADEEVRSVGGAATFDCGAGRVKVEQYAAYALPHLQGRPMVQVGRQSAWRAVSGDTTLGRVKARVCAGFPARRPPGPGASRSALTAHPFEAHARSVGDSIPSAPAAAIVKPTLTRRWTGVATDSTSRDVDAPVATAAEARLSAPVDAAAFQDPSGVPEARKLKLRGRL
jgi:hypothetical protein